MRRRDGSVEAASTTTPMLTTKTTVVLSTTALALALGVSWLLHTPSQAAPPSPGEAADVALGRHLVQDVALCADCHAPRLPSGEFDNARWLGGAPIPFAPTIDMPWAFAAPPIAGLASYPEEHVVSVLRTGARSDGTRPLPPMPAFKLTEDEARAVVAYLRTLPAAP